MIIGVIGGSGSGKSTFCQAAVTFGYTVIDGDQIGHAILKKGRAAYQEVLAAFGPAILAPDGEIDRGKLAAVVFSNPSALAVLNRITHSKITEAILAQVSAPGTKAVIDAAMLHTTPLLEHCDKVVFVQADRAIRLQRIMARDQLSLEEAEARLDSQPDDADFARCADVVIENNGTQAQTKRLAAQFFAEVNR